MTRWPDLELPKWTSSDPDAAPEPPKLYPQAPLSSLAQPMQDRLDVQKPGGWGFK